MRLFNKRMQLARSGAVFYREGKMKEAVQNYFAYIDILEHSKEVEKGKLSPKNFDSKKDIAELLLLSGVFWDLAKLHDKVSDSKNLERLRYYLDRVVLFSKGLAYENISAELIRKYLVNGKPKNRKEFKDAHIRLGGGKCFIATAVEDYCEPTTLPSLRAFRDEVLLKNAVGKISVWIYYQIGPTLARFVLKAPTIAQFKLAHFLDRVATQLHRN